MSDFRSGMMCVLCVFWGLRPNDRHPHTEDICLKNMFLSVLLQPNLKHHRPLAAISLIVLSIRMTLVNQIFAYKFHFFNPSLS
jgi:hypothetical protein